MFNQRLDMFFKILVLHFPAINIYTIILQMQEVNVNVIPEVFSNYFILRRTWCFCFCLCVDPQNPITAFLSLWNLGFIFLFFVEDLFLDIWLPFLQEFRHWIQVCKARPAHRSFNKQEFIFLVQLKFEIGSLKLIQMSKTKGKIKSFLPSFSI